MSAALLLYLVRPEMSVSEKYEYVYDFFSRMAGREHVGEQSSPVPARASLHTSSRKKSGQMSFLQHISLQVVLPDIFNIGMLPSNLMHSK